MGRPVGSAANHPRELSWGPQQQKTFIDERKMGYRLFSDPQNGVAEEYDNVHDLDGMAGISEPRPAVFRLDGEQTIRYVWVVGKWPEFSNYDETEDELEAL